MRGVRCWRFRPSRRGESRGGGLSPVLQGLPHWLHCACAPEMYPHSPAGRQAQQSGTVGASQCEQCRCGSALS